ncbi:Flavin-containing monooxygenase FMO GS-OX-like 1-like protein [Drosera capensis]
MGSVEVAVAVIGAGAAGLVAARELKREGHGVTVFEKSGKVGGIWVYDPQVDSDDPIRGEETQLQVHSSMYLSLRTNLPRPLMGFSDFPLTEESHYGDPRMFPGHHEVLSFLNHFAAEYGLLDLIRFNTEVVRVESSLTENGRRWVVDAVASGGIYSKDVFDAVVICNGHVTVPRLPHIPGVEKWPGKQTHSHNYRVPEPFKDEVVVIIGSGASAYDISRDTAKVAKEVHLSSRSPLAKLSRLNAYPNIWLHSGVVCANGDGKVTFQDGSAVHADTMLHCTGYNYDHSFLKTNGSITIDDNRVGPLYKHVFPPDLSPGLSFVGLPHKTILFLMMELQSRWIAQVLSGKVSLPSKENMIADIDCYFRQMEELKRPIHQTHFLFNPEEFGYLDWIAQQVGSPAVEEWKKEMYRKVIKQIECHDDEFRGD